MNIVFSSLGFPGYRDQGGVVLRDAVDLHLGLGCVRAFARAVPAIAARTAMVNRSFPADAEPLDAARVLAELAPDVAALGCYLWNRPKVLEAARELKRRRPRARVVLGGPDVPRREEELAAFLAAAPWVDVAVPGEGERPFAGLLIALLDGRPLDRTPGLAFQESGRVRVSSPAPALEDLSAAPSPYLTGDVTLAPGLPELVSLETSRGCPYSCSYCNYHGARRKVRFFPIERLRAELALLAARGHRGPVYLADPMLNADKERALAVLRELARKDLRYILEFKAEACDQELMAAFAAIPRAHAAVGVQTINPAALRLSRRPFDLGRATANLARLGGRGDVCVELILGLPGDDYDGFKRTLDWALSFEPPLNLRVFDLIVLPSTPLARDAARLGIVADARGSVLSSASFGVEDRARSARLLCAYAAALKDAGLLRRWRAFIARGARPPTAFLETLAAALARRGRLPPDPREHPTDLFARPSR